MPTPLFKNKQYWLKNLVLIAWLGLLAYGFHITAQRSYQVTRIKQRAKITSPPLSELSPKIVRVISLGHHGLLELFFSFWTIQIMVDKDLLLSDPEQAIHTILTVARQKVRVEHFYLLACFVLMEDLNKPELCEQVSQIGLSVFPLSWRIPMTQGFVYYFKLKDPLRASFYYSLAASRTERSPPYVRNVAIKLAKQAQVREDELQKLMDEIYKFKGGETFKEILHEAKTNQQQQSDSASPKDSEKEE